MGEHNSNFRKKKIGWLCSYVPEELILAAEMEPVRIQEQAEKIKEADAHMFPNLCPYLQNILDSGLRGKLENLEGIIFTNSCDGMRRLYDVWRNYVQMPFSYMLEVPKNRDEHAIQYYSEQLLGLKTRLEEVLEVDISKHKLEKTISLMNNHRAMIMELFERQKETIPHYNGSELFALCLKEMTYPKDETTQKLKTQTDQLRTPNSSPDKSPRLLIIGNVIDKPNLFNMVEAAKASVVAFDTCTGMRHYSGLVEEGLDPIQCLARRYLLKPPCSRMSGLDKRIERVEQLIRDFSIDGIIYSNVKFCDYGMFEAPVIEKGLQDRRTPLLALENDYLWGDEARIKTRVEAFVEMIKGEFS